MVGRREIVLDRPRELSENRSATLERSIVAKLLPAGGVSGDRVGVGAVGRRFHGVFFRWKSSITPCLRMAAS